MKSKTIKILIITLIIVLVILGSLCIIDHIKMKNNEHVIFSTWGKKYAQAMEISSEKIVSMYKTIIDDLIKNHNTVYPSDQYISLDVNSLKAPNQNSKKDYRKLTEEEQNELLKYCKNYHEEVKNLSIEELKERGFNKGNETFIELEGALLRVIKIEKLTENKAVIWFQSFHTGLGAVMPKYELNYKNGEWSINVREMAVS